MNIANRLTLFRVFLAVAFLVFIEFPFNIALKPMTELYFRGIALIIFIAAMLTDLYDGKLARKYNIVTDFGKLMDPLADKILITSALLSYVSKHYISVWVVMIIISREFFVTGIRLIGASKGKIIAAGILGKHKTAWQIVLIYELVLEEMANLAYMSGVIPFIYPVFLGLLILRYLLIATAIFFTIYSGYQYLVENISLFQGRNI